jgi:hypothetical protein
MRVMSFEMAEEEVEEVGEEAIFNQMETKV